MQREAIIWVERVTIKIRHERQASAVVLVIELGVLLTQLTVVWASMHLCAHLSVSCPSEV